MDEKRGCGGTGQLDGGLGIWKDPCPGCDDPGCPNKPEPLPNPSGVLKRVEALEVDARAASEDSHDLDERIHWLEHPDSPQDIQEALEGLAGYLRQEGAPTLTQFHLSTVQAWVGEREHQTRADQWSDMAICIQEKDTEIAQLRKMVKDQDIVDQLGTEATAELFRENAKLREKIDAVRQARPVFAELEKKAAEGYTLMNKALSGEEKTEDPNG